MGMFNDSSVLTRGFGIIHRVLTRGFGKKYDPGGSIPTFRHKEYIFDILCPISKQNSGIVKIECPINFVRDGMIEILSPIKKEITVELKISSFVDTKKLRNILEEL